MTQVVAWVRTTHNQEELVVASDSRLRFGREWDACPKIFPLKRGDCVVAFSGDTQYAYPFILQVINSVDYHQKLRSRALDLFEFKGHFLRIINKMHNHIFNTPKGENMAPDVKLMLAGYSWKYNKFAIWDIFYQISQNSFITHSQSTIKKNLVSTIGDQNIYLRKKIFNLVKDKNSNTLDMEPYEAMCEIINHEVDISIGGAPQMFKIFKHLNCIPYIIIWKDSLYLNGRPLLKYEKPNFNLYDSDQQKFFKWEQVIDRFPRVSETNEDIKGQGYQPK